MAKVVKMTPGLAASLLSVAVGIMSIAPSYAQKVRVFGDRFHHPALPNEWIRPYVDMPKDHDGDTTPLAVGIQMTVGYIRYADQLPMTYNSTVTIEGGPEATIPDSETLPVHNMSTPFVVSNIRTPIHFPQVGRNPFKWAAYTYNLYGHVPIGVYDYQHFDMRVFFDTPEWWASEFSWDTLVPGVCGHMGPERFAISMRPLPEECWPGDPTTSVNLGHAIFNQGTHIYDLEEPGWQAYLQGSGVDHVDSTTWGIQDGRVAYLEAMFSRDLALQEGVNECHDISKVVPKHFNTPRLAPTRKCLVAGKEYIKLEYTNFIEVPGGCEDMFETSTLVGYTSQEVVDAIHGKGICPVPVPPP